MRDGEIENNIYFSGTFLKSLKRLIHFRFNLVSTKMSRKSHANYINDPNKAFYIILNNSEIKRNNFSKDDKKNN